MPRQDWTREQTIVALRAYFIVPFNKASDNQVEIVKTAAIIGRKASAVKMKIGNFGSLDPELAKRGIRGLTENTRLDRAVWAEFANDREKLAVESERLIAQFINKPLELVETEEQMRTGDDVYRVTKTRVNQNFFRDRVVGMYDTTCCITGITAPELLIASHIVPWSVDERHRLDPENGLCLNALHDKAFDSGLITVTPDYRVKLSKQLQRHKNKEVLTKYFLAYEGQSIILPERYFPNAEFLKYHNEAIFVG
jgi:putative restriction endonuclease